MSREKRENGVLSTVFNDDVYGPGGQMKLSLIASYAFVLTITFSVVLLVQSSTSPLISFDQWWRPSSNDSHTSTTSWTPSSNDSDTRTTNWTPSSNDSDTRTTNWRPSSNDSNTRTTNWHNLLVQESSNYTGTLESLLLANATINSTCYSSSTKSTNLEGLPNSVDGKIFFQTDKLYRLTLVAYDEHGEKRCAGGDYYEVDFHDRERGHYKSRLPTMDLGNGSYGLDLLVPSRFAGAFTIDIYHLYGNWHGMELDTLPWFKTDLILTQELDMVVAEDHLNSSKTPAIEQCTPADFDRTTWQGRWSRSWFNSNCEPNEFSKRYLCVPPEHYWCDEPWCFGPVGRLESNGWQYSAHCSFKIFQQEEAWKCLDGRWFFVWGDSNFQDTIRNLLLFIMDWPLPSLKNLADFELTRNYEMAFTNPHNFSQLFRVSQLFNGAASEFNNLEGLHTITQHPEHRDVLTAHFNSTTWPDTIIMNSGLHDGSAWSTLEAYSEAADFMIEFWMNIYNSLPVDRRPTLIWRATVAPAGSSRSMPGNPMKMEMYNQIIAEKLQRVRDRLPVKIVDAFDLTFAFHYNHEYSDGGHYGRAPGTNMAPWYKGPHWYFVDIMLAHILLNALCPST